MDPCDLAQRAPSAMRSPEKQGGGDRGIRDTPRVRSQVPEDYPWYLRPFFWRQQQSYGRVLEAALIWARSPCLFLGIAFLYGMMDRKSSPLDPALRSLLMVRVSQLNGCRFCVDLNSAMLAKRGVGSAKIDDLDRWQASGRFDARERAVLGYAEAMTDPAIGVSDEAFDAVTKHFDEDVIVELTGLIAFQNMSSKFNSALAVPSQGFCRITASVANPIDGVSQPDGGIG